MSDVKYIEEGRQIYGLASEIYPICRSITGNGVRQTFEILKKYMPDIKLSEVPTGTQVFDWTVPREWKIRDAYIQRMKSMNVCGMKKRLVLTPLWYISETFGKRLN